MYLKRQVNSLHYFVAECVNFLHSLRYSIFTFYGHSVARLGGS
jgi:hypothetical protein